MSNTIHAAAFFHVPESAAQDAEDIKHIMKQPAGRRLMRRLFETSRVMGPVMGPDGRTTEYYEGMRAIGLWLATRLEEATPGAVAALMAESAKDRMNHQPKATKGR